VLPGGVFFGGTTAASVWLLKITTDDISNTSTRRYMMFVFDSLNDMITGYYFTITA
jgi:hypothetical protein